MSALRRTIPALLLVAGVATAATSQVQAAAPTCAGEPATLVGTTRADHLVGTPKRDVIVGLGGDDVIAGRGGHDVVCGGAGADELRGGAGDDSLHGNSDRLSSDVTGTYLTGDVLHGGPGDDRLDGGFDDRAAQARRRPDTVSWADAPHGVVVDLTAGTASGLGSDRISTISRLRVVGSQLADQITGSARPDVISGEGGDDRILAGAGADTIFTERAEVGPDLPPDADVVDAGPGDDLVSSQLGVDRLLGGDGHDFLEAYSSEPSTVMAGSGNDYVAQHLVGTSGAKTWGGPGTDVASLFGKLLEGGVSRTEVTVDLGTKTVSADVVPTATGRFGGFEQHRLIGNLGWRFHGTPGPDRLWTPTGGPLSAWTYEGNDSVTASDRADYVHAGPGTDVAWGRGGDDTCRSAERGAC